MTPHLDSEIMPQNDLTSTLLVSHTIFTFVNVTLVVAEFVKRANRRTVQDISGCHRP
jgi:hypothetical protein